VAARGRLGAEEWLEQVRPDVIGDAGSCIGDAEHHVVADRVITIRGAADPAVVRMARVLVATRRCPPSGIASRALTTRFINTWPSWPASAFSRPIPRVAIDRQFDVVADQLSQHAIESIDHIVEIQHDAVFNLIAAEREQLLREASASFSGAKDLLDILTHALALRQCSEQQVGVANDHRQNVVEVVRDTARQPPHELLVSVRDQFALPAVFSRVMSWPTIDAPITSPSNDRVATTLTATCVSDPSFFLRTAS